jgi:hypothetical protein
MASEPQVWTAAELRSELARFESELEAAGLKPASVATYVKGGETFVRWLEGDFVPRGPV